MRSSAFAEFSTIGTLLEIVGQNPLLLWYQCVLFPSATENHSEPFLGI